MAANINLPKHNPGTSLEEFRAALQASIILQSVRFDIGDPATAKSQSLDVDGLILKFTGCKKRHMPHRSVIERQETKPSTAGRNV